MERLKYKVIESEKQYFDYCNKLEHLVFGRRTKAIDDEINLLTVLIEKYDDEYCTPYDEADPVELLRFLMDDHKLKAKDLAGILGISKGLVSDILNYKKGMSKDVIRILAGHFKMSQEAFNRPYLLKGALKLSDKKINALQTGKLKMAG